MIDNANLEAILLTATDISIVCEIYASDAVPGANGFDPADAIDCFAAVEGITFATRTYKRLVTSFGRIKRTISEESNSTSVEFSNLDNQISDFEFDNGFEGLILVIRLLSRSLSTALTDTQILFTGRCDKPKSGNRESLSVTAKFILGSLDVMVPRRRFSKEDQEGRVQTDPEFEGFIFTPQYGTTSYTRVEKKRVFFFFTRKKTVTKTLQYSSYSDLDANKYVPEVWGRAQIEGVHVAYDDVGTFIRMVVAFCEGPISNFTPNARSVDQNLPLDTVSYAELYGLVGIANGIDPLWVGPGYYSRTAHIRCKANNSTIEDVDAAPTVVAAVLGRLMTIPDASGDWVLDDEWTDNGAAHARFLITTPEYGNLNEAWIHDESFAEVYEFNAQNIYDTSSSDFTFVEEG